MLKLKTIGISSRCYTLLARYCFQLLGLALFSASMHAQTVRLVRPTARTVLPDSLFRLNGPGRRPIFMEDVASRVRHWVGPKYDYSYVKLTHGFAIITNLVEVDSAGRVLGRPIFRDRTHLGPLNPEFWEALRSRPRFYRLVVLAVVDERYVAPAAPLTHTRAMDWVQRGQETVPASLRGIQFPGSFHCAAYVYEFRHSYSYEPAWLVQRPSLSARDYLGKIGIPF